MTTRGPYVVGMSEKPLEKLEFTDVGERRRIGRSTSPGGGLVAGSPGAHRFSRSPRPVKRHSDLGPTPPPPLMMTAATSPQPPPPPVLPANTQTVPPSPSPLTPSVRDSRPDIVSWPAPPPTTALAKPTRSIAIGASGAAPAAAAAPRTTSTGTSPIPESDFQSAAVRNLESTIAEYERQKGNVMCTFSEYREYVAERERTLEAEYSNKIIALSEEVLGAKKDFEARMKSFQLLQEQFVHEKEQALENLRIEHRQEIEMLERRVEGSQLLNLEQKYILEIRRLEDERKSLKVEKERLGETFDTKLRRAQSLYETQLSAAKTLYTKELEALRTHEEHLKQELSARHEEFRDRVQELKMQARQGREEVTQCKTELTILQKRLKEKEGELQGLTKELETVRVDLRASMQRLKETEEWRRQTNALHVRTSEELSEKERALNEKAELLEAADGTRTRLESVIRKLQIEVNGLRNKIDFVEIERDNLQCQSESASKLQNSQVQALEAVLESVTKEKDTSKEHYERLLEQEREQAEAREDELRRELSSKFSELEDQYNALKEYVDTSGTLGPTSSKILDDVETLRAQKACLEREVTSLQSQLSRDRSRWSEGESPSVGYISDMLRRVDALRRHADERGGAFKSGNMIDIGGVDLLKESMQHEAAAASGGNQTERLVHKLSLFERDVQVLIRDKNEAKARLAKLEAENKSLAKRLEEARRAERADELATLREQLEARSRANQELDNNMREMRSSLEKTYREEMRQQRSEMESKVKQLENRLGEADEAARREDARVRELKNKQREADLRNRVLSEILAYQSPAVEDVVDTICCEMRSSSSEASSEALRAKLEKFDAIKQMQMPQHVEPRLPEKKKPQIREMALQTNIELLPPPPTKSEKLQKEILGLLAGMVGENSLDNQYALMELKQALLAANADTQASPATSDESQYESSSRSASRVPQVCHKAANKLHSIISHIERRSRSKPPDDDESPSQSQSGHIARQDMSSDERRRSRSPSLLSRLRERAPSKSRSSIAANLMETSVSSAKNLLFASSSTSTAAVDIERDGAKRSGSGRRAARDGPRPAWKF